ncbi:MAG: acyl-CoA dehydrogenase family protein [Candidatus Hydrogenedentes bacterium]|nr:acyl-CoA dehydrogenase family protein [Candidatus Hydrogenedentota bacterium]
MDFAITDQLRNLLNDIRSFLEAEAFPLERAFLHEGFGAVLPGLERLRARVKERGWWLPQVPKAEGGVGLSLLEHGLVSAELGRTPLGHYLFNCQAPDSGNMEVLLLHGTPAQKDRFLKPLLAGRIRSCFSMTEPEHPGSNPVWMSTTAVRDGDHYVINGHKWFTSSAEGATFAVVMAVTDPNGPLHQRASMLLVPCDTPGFKIVCNTSIMGHRGEGWSGHAEIRYENCRVPKENLLGQEGAGFAIAQERLGPGRIHHCMRWIGICERSFDLMCAYAARREVAPGQTLGTRQFVQGWIAESRAEIDAARLLVLRAAWMIDQFGAKEARNEISLIKFYVANVLQRVVDRAIQTHGGLGVTDEIPLSFFWRAERSARIYDGPDEVHKLVVAKRILRKYGVEVHTGGA